MQTSHFVHVLKGCSTVQKIEIEIRMEQHGYFNVTGSIQKIGRAQAYFLEVTSTIININFRSLFSAVEQPFYTA